jgi:hypothetical protein
VARPRRLDHAPELEDDGGIVRWIGQWQRLQMDRVMAPSDQLVAGLLTGL